MASGNATDQSHGPSLGNLLLLRVEKRVGDLLCERLGGHIALQRLQTPEELYVALEQNGIRTDAMLLGVDLMHPVRVVQRVHGYGMDIPALIMTEPERYEQLTQALKFAPFIGNDVKSWCSASLESLPRVISETIRRAQKRRQFKGSIAEAQRRLGTLTNERPQAPHYFDRLLDRAPIGVLNVDIHCGILNLNRYACQILEVSEREALGTHLTHFFPASEHSRLRDIIAGCVAPMRKPLPEVLDVRSNSGVRRCVEMTAASMVDRTGHLGATIILQDVTDRVRAERKRRRTEEALQSSEARYRELIQTMNEAMAVTDQDYCISFVNQSFCDMFDYSVSEVVGRPLLDLVHPDNKAMMAERMAGRDICPAQRFESAWVARGGRTIHTLTSPRIFLGKDGKVSGCLGVFTDITDRKRVEQELSNSEAQLRLVTDAIPALILYLDREQRIQLFNRAFGDWYGVERKATVDVHLREVIGDAAYEAIRPGIEAALKGKIVECEQSLIFRDRVERDVRCTLVPDLDDRVNLRGLVAVISDITESKRVEQWERAHLQELAHASRITTIGEMSSQIAHELAQPLSAIGGLSTALLKLLAAGQATPDDTRDALAEISAQSRRAREIVIRLRDFVRNEEIRHVPIDINELIRTVIRLANAEARHRRLDVKLDLMEGLPQTMGDRILLEQVLLNLVRNAMEAMEEHDGKLHLLSIRSADCEDGSLKVTVSDTGPGLSAELIAKIFEPFFTTKADGMGMGLAITRSVIDAHGGRLRAEPNPGGGATFHFTLPIDASAGQDYDRETDRLHRR